MHAQEIASSLVLGGAGSARRGHDPSAHLSSHAGALATLACAIAEEAVRLFPCEGVGGVRGHDLLLPEEMPFPGEAGRLHFVVRTSIGAELVREQAWRSSETSPELAELSALRLARRAVDALCLRFASFAERHAEATRRELASRPDPARLEGRARLLESVRQEALRGERPWERDTLVEALRASAPEPRSAADGLLLWGARIDPPLKPRVDALRHGLPDAGCAGRADRFSLPLRR